MAAVTGGHAFDLPAFIALWHNLPGIDAYPQHLEDFLTNVSSVRSAYDTVVFHDYHMLLETVRGYCAASKGELEED